MSTYILLVAIITLLCLTWCLLGSRRELNKLQSQLNVLRGPVSVDDEFLLDSMSSLSDEILQSVVRNPELNWIESFGEKILMRMCERHKGLSGAILYPYNDDTLMSTFRCDPLLEMLLASSVDFSGRHARIASGVMERHGISASEYRFVDIRENQCCMVWIGCSGASLADMSALVSAIRLLEQHLEEISGKIISLSRHDAILRRGEVHSKFLQQVSHDIRSPLNNVRSIFHVITLEGLSSENKDLIAVGLKNIDAMGEIVDTILDYTSHASGHLHPCEEEISLESFIDDVVQSYRIAADMKGLRLVCRIENGSAVRADPKHLRRILNNLISNAIKYSLHGEVSIIGGQSGDVVAIEIRDNGIGMTSKELESLFQPFSRFHREMADGAGLGLVVVKQLLEANHGAICVSSQYGKGSSFFITLQSAARKGIPLQTNMQIKNKGFRLLLVDDDRDWLESLRRNLLAHTEEISTAHSWGEALGLIHLCDFDILISDYEMKGGGPEAVVAAIRRKNPSCKVIILSGRSSEAVARKISDCTVLQKPIVFEDLKDILWQDVSLTVIKNVA